jgi:hypothetical protein
MVRGDHKHVMRDISLADESGSSVLTAKRASMLGGNYGIVDPQGQKKGQVSSKNRITQTSFEISDQAGGVLATMVERIHERYAPRNCWLENAAGDRLGTFEFASGILSFGLVKSDGSRIFDASMAGEGGLMERLQSLGTQRMDVRLFDRTFSPVLLIGIIAAIDSGLR